MSITKKIVAGLVSLATTVSLASPVFAVTAQDLLAQIQQLQQQLNQLMAQYQQLTGQAPSTQAAVPAACTGITFERNLSQGMRGNDVKCLQALLNTDPDTKVAESGPGSPGNETTHFGLLTKAAVVKFQEKYAAEVLTPSGLSAGTGFVGPKTRAKLNSLLQAGVAAAPKTEEKAEEEVTPEVTEPTARLASDTPAATTLPTSSSKVPVLKVILQAADKDLTVTSMTFKRTGVGSAADWSALYLYVDDMRVTPYGRSISSDTQLVEFPALNISIPAGSSKSVTLRADVASGATAGNQSVFQLVSVTPTMAGLPITGNTMTIGGVGVSTVTVTTGLSISDPVVGTEGATIGSFKITAGTQNVELKQVILTVSGTIARANVTNIKLYYENELLAEATGVDVYDNVILTLAQPYAIAKGVSRTFTVKADLGGRVGEKLQVKIQGAGDLLVIDKVYGYGAVVSGSFPVASTEITLKGGTLSLADQGPLAGEIAKNSQDVVLKKVGLTASRDLEVVKLKVTLRSSATTTGITDLRIKDADTGATLMQKDATTADGFLAGTTTSPQTLSGPFLLSANTTRNILITVDVGSGATTDVNIAADLGMETYAADYVYVRDVLTGDYVKSADVIPASVTGADQKIVAVSLSLALASSPISSTVITGAKDVSAIGLLLTAGGGSDVTIRSITAKVNVNTASNFTATGTVATRDKVSLVKLYEGGATSPSSQKTLEEQGTEGTNAHGLAKFDGLNISIAKGQSKNLVIKIDTASNLTQKYYVAVSVAKADIDARDPDNNAITVGGVGANTFTYGTAPSRVVTIETQGSLNLAKNEAGTPASANIPVGGATDGKAGVTLLAIDLSAEKENVKVTEIGVEETGTSDDKAYKALYLYDGDNKVGQTVFAAGATTTKFTNLEVEVPAGGKKTLTLKADLAGIDGTYVVSASTTKLKVATNTIKAVGVSSGKTINAGGSVAEGNEQYLYKTTVKVALSSDTPRGTVQPGTEQDVLHLDFINEGSYDATLKNATFTIAYNKGSSSVSTTTERTFKLVDAQGNLVATITSSGMETAINGATIAFTSIGKILPAGTTTKLILKGNTMYVETGKNVYQSFNVNAVSDIVWNDGNVDVSSLHFVAPLSGGTLTY